MLRSRTQLVKSHGDDLGELERRSAHQLRLKAIEMLQSSILDQLTNNDGDDLGQGYL